MKIRNKVIALMLISLMSSAQADICWLSDCGTGIICCCCTVCCLTKSDEEPVVDSPVYEDCTNSDGDRCSQSSGEASEMCEGTCTVNSTSKYTRTASAGAAIQGAEFGLSGEWEDAEFEGANCTSGVSVSPRECCYAKTWRRYEKTTISRTEGCITASCDYTTVVKELLGCDEDTHGLDCEDVGGVCTCPDNPLPDEPEEE